MRYRTGYRTGYGKHGTYVPAFQPSGTYTDSGSGAVGIVGGGEGEPSGSFFGVFQPGGIQDDSPFSGGQSYSNSSIAGLGQPSPTGMAGSLTSNHDAGLGSTAFGVTADKKVSGATARVRQLDADKRMYMQWGIIAAIVIGGGYILLRAYRKA